MGGGGGVVFVFNDTATTEIYTLSLHDALPISKVTPKTGQLISSHAIIDQTELLAISSRSQILKTTIKSVRKAGRATQGVRIMKLEPGDEIVGTVCL